MNAEERLEVLRQRYESGQAEALLDAINICLSKPTVAPGWVQTAFGRGYVRYIGNQVKDLGEAFGIRRPRYFDLTAARRSDQRYDVYLRVRALHKAGTPISKELFGAVGKEFNMGSTKAEELYYEVKRVLAAR